MANKDDSSVKDIINFAQHKNNSDGLSFLHQQNIIMGLTPTNKSGKRQFFYS